MRTKYRQPSRPKTRPSGDNSAAYVPRQWCHPGRSAAGSCLDEDGPSHILESVAHHVTLSSAAEKNVLYLRVRSLERPPLWVSGHTASPPWSATDKNIAQATCAHRRNDSSGSLPLPYHTHTRTHTCKDVQANILLMRARTQAHVQTRARTCTCSDANTDATKACMRRALIFEEK